MRKETEKLERQDLEDDLDRHQLLAEIRAHQKARDKVNMRPAAYDIDVIAELDSRIEDMLSQLSRLKKSAAKAATRGAVKPKTQTNATGSQSKRKRKQQRNQQQQGNEKRQRKSAAAASNAVTFTVATSPKGKGKGKGQNLT
eukprot:SAG11_NODE_1966_length_3988_cov_16.269221_3_plen_142_part_00